MSLITSLTPPLCFKILAEGHKEREQIHTRYQMVQEHIAALTKAILTSQHLLSKIDEIAQIMLNPATTKEFVGGDAWMSNYQEATKAFSSHTISITTLAKRAHIAINVYEDELQHTKLIHGTTPPRELQAQLDTQMRDYQEGPVDSTLKIQERINKMLEELSSFEKI